MFEAGFGSGFNTPDSELTWTDLTSRLWNWDETTGIQYQLGALQATNLTLHLTTSTAYLITTNTASPVLPERACRGPRCGLRAALGTLGGVTSTAGTSSSGTPRSGARRSTSSSAGTPSHRHRPVGGAVLRPADVLPRRSVRGHPVRVVAVDDQPGNAGVLPTQLLNAALGNTNTLNITLSPNGAASQQAVLHTDGHSTVSAGSAGASVSAGHRHVHGRGRSGWMFGDPLGSPPSSLATGNPESSTRLRRVAADRAGREPPGRYGWYLICNDASFPPLSGGITVEGWFNYQFFGTGTGIPHSVTGTGTSRPHASSRTAR